MLEIFCRSSPVSAKKYSHVPSATNELKELCRELFNAVKDCTVSYFSLLESSFSLSLVIDVIRQIFLLQKIALNLTLQGQVVQSWVKITKG